ncbi:MAG: hypothetical protein NC930_02150, partial [Candidatus Omnitrophica bacterium]|nr:hypothetical protein [Candidatus Omnitrophota bacterium]
VLAGNMGPTESGIFERRFETLGRRVETELHYKKITVFLLPTPIHLNLDDYQGDEPQVAPLPQVKSDSRLADSGKDDTEQNLTYEKYRALPIS